MAIRRIPGKIIRFIFTTNSAYWFEKDLIDKIPDLKTEIPVNIDTNSTKKTIDWLKKQKHSWVINANEIKIALKYNHCWASAKINKKIIGSIKIGYSKVYISDYEKVFDLSEKTAFIYDTYVLEEYRKKGVAKLLISEAVKYLKNKGYAKVGCHIPAWNIASINAYEKIGFKKMKYIRYIKIFGLSFRITKSPLKSSFLKGVEIKKVGISYE
jgi:ribosomal protein S18 acetylase RimI-like enzyme